VYVIYSNANGKESSKLYFCIDVTMPAAEIFLYYHSHFQIEFLYRDGKQHTRMEDPQARSENKLNFQFNASLTSIYIAKVIHWLKLPKEE